MARVGDVLEDQVAAIRLLQAHSCRIGSAARQRGAIDGHYAALLRRIAPRIRHFTRAYGLLDHAEDAAQACAIGLLRAIATYDLARAKFTTLLNWQLRCELQALRFRLRDDARESARKVGAVTLSLDALLEQSGEGGWAGDDGALAATESGAAEAMARRACGSLLARWRGDRRDGDDIRRLESESRIAEAWLIGEDEDRVAALAGTGLSAEQGRQVARRVSRAMVALAATAPNSERSSAH